MKLREDTRPTLASWPKRIFELEELPPVYQPFLNPWLTNPESPMPLGNITYIPKVHQYKAGPECALAWYGRDVMLLMDDSGTGSIRKVLIPAGSILGMDYFVSMLECRVTLTLDSEPAKQEQFRYNKTKEDQIAPVLNVLLDNPPDYLPHVFTHSNEALSDLEEKSYAMYNTSKLIYRFDETVRDYYWARGKDRQLFGRKKEDPEYLIAVMEKGIAVVSSQFYGIQASYLPWSRIQSIAFRPDYPIRQKRRTFRQPAIVLTAEPSREYAVPLLPEQAAPAEQFLSRIQTAARRPTLV